LDSDDIFSSEYGSFIGSFGGYGKKPGFFRQPRGLITDTEDYIMIADSGIKLFHFSSLLLNICMNKFIIIFVFSIFFR